MLCGSKMSVVSHYPTEPLEIVAEYENMIYQPGIGKKLIFLGSYVRFYQGQALWCPAFCTGTVFTRAKGFNIYIPDLEICFECTISQQSVIIAPIILRQKIFPSGYKKSNFSALFLHYFFCTLTKVKSAPG
jgi:hypothetical protein